MAADAGPSGPPARGGPDCLKFNRYVGGHDNLFCRAVRRPGMAIQRWTTFEPDDSMIEVGIEALKQVLPKEKGKDQW